jgi:tetratricopeptide (TPR) repeat protein
MSEPVAWIAGRTDAFAALWTLAALALARARRERRSEIPPRRALLLAGAALACAGLALLSKEAALVLPLLVAADAIDGSGGGALANARGRAALRAAWPFAAVVAVWALLHRAVVAGSSHPPTPGAAQAAAALVWAHLAWLVPWAPHSPLLDLWHAPAFPLAALAWAGLAAVGGCGVWLARRRVPLLLPLALLFLPLLPVAAASLLEAGVRFAERALALPVAGMALALAGLAARAPAARRPLAVAAIAGWALLQGGLALAPIAAWADEESRIRRIAQVRPRDLDALLGLADLLSTQGREREAGVWIERAEAVAPNDPGPPIARASLAFRAGRNDEALAFAERAGAIDPASLAAGVIRVRALARLHRAAAATAAADSIVAAHPGEPAALGAQGVARLAAGDAAGAVAPLDRASRQLLDDAGLAWDLGRAAIAVGDVARAREAFERAVIARAGCVRRVARGRRHPRPPRRRRGRGRGATPRGIAPGASDGRAAELRARIAQRSKP